MIGRSYCRLVLVLVLVGTATTATARAQAQGSEDDEAQTERARELFQEGIALGDEQRWLEAAKRFRSALRIKDAPAIRYNLASALYEAGRWLAAADALQKVIEHPDADDALRASAEELLATIESDAAQLVINVLGSGTGTYVRVDDQVVPASQYGKPLQVAPGSHEVSAEVARSTVSLDSGEQGEVSLEWAASDGQPQDAPSSSPSLAKDWRLWAGVSAGLAALSIALIAVAASK